MTTDIKDRLYQGHPSPGGAGRVTVEDENGNVSSLTLHERHSPDGHLWGYEGSGPAQLALDLLWDHLGDEPRSIVYQAFKSAHVATWPTPTAWELSSDEIQTFLESNFPTQPWATPDV